MKFVLDANILFAAFIRQRSDIRKILLSTKIELYSPEWILEEFDKNQEELVKKMDNKDNFLETKELLFSFIKIVPKEMYEDYIHVAQKELGENLKDVPYIALSLFLNAALWSNDSELKKQKLVRLITTREMIEMFLDY